MNKLNFTPINQAFILGSQQIKDTQEEIAKLKALVLDSEIKKPTGMTEQKDDSYKRIGNADKTTAIFSKPESQYDYNDFDFNLLRIIKHPKFDDVVKNYVLINHPDWLLKETRYTSNNSPGPIPATTGQTYYGNYPKSGNNGVSTFGNKYSTTFCSEIKNYIIFFLVSLIIYLLLSKYFD